MKVEGSMRGRHGRGWRILGLAVMLLPLFLAACTGDPQDTLTRKGDVSARITDLFMPVFLYGVIPIFVVVEAALIIVVLRYRRRPGQTGLPAQTHGSTPLELTWTIIPAVILALLAIPTVDGIRYLADTPDGALKVNVVGHQWWWEFQYPDDNFNTAGELVIPAGRPVEVTITSQDVIHSFWVPQLAGKMDAVPGRQNKMWFNAREPGRFSGQCAEFCALSHAKMKFEVVALEPADYQAWVQSQQAPAAAPGTTLARQGQEFFFATQCIACHAVRGQEVNGRQAIGNLGPDLTHFASRERFAGAWLENNEEDLRAWLADPPKIKPGSKMPNYNLTDEQITQLIAYMQSLR